MTPWPPLLTLLASLGGHLAALGLLLLFDSGEPVATPLVIDLSALESPADRPGSTGEPAGPPRADGGAGPRASSPRVSSPRAASLRAASPPAASPAPASAPVEPAPPAIVRVPPKPQATTPPVTAIVPVQPESAPTETVVEPPREAAVAPAPPAPSAPAVATKPAPGSDQSSPASGAGIGRRPTQWTHAGTGGGGSAIALAPVGPSGGAGGPGGTGGSEYGPYYGQIRQRILETLEYPHAARRQGMKGTVLLELTIKPNGAISAVVKASSSHPLLDDAALETVRNLPRMPFPPGLAPRHLTVPLPVVFDLK